MYTVVVLLKYLTLHCGPNQYAGHIVLVVLCLIVFWWLRGEFFDMGFHSPTFIVRLTYMIRYCMTD